jgi:formylglycine-generating enzyme required for sulfatase activity/tRNA A-37 threonylcarbamoyl transferase component Bud32
MEARTLGDYTIIKQIGQGSLGTVYLAEHRFMKRQYVLKVLPEELGTDRAFVQRFEDEVRRLASLEHPHIVKIHNVSYAQGVYFLVTDCVVDSLNESMTLAQYLHTNEGKLEEKELLTILRQVADALDYAHSTQGAIVHRGLKPSNILLGKGKGGLEVYLSDFGLSKMVGAGYALSKIFAGLTESLSPEASQAAKIYDNAQQNYAFLAPEQRSVGSEVGIQADVYAFGVLAYYLLTGSYPEGIFEMPSCELNWDALIQSCLQQDPAKRPECLLDALDEVEEAPEPQEVAYARPEPAMAIAEPSVRVVTPKSLGAPVPPKASMRVEDQPSLAEALQVTRPNPQVKPFQVQSRDGSEIEPILTESVSVEGGSFWRGSNEGSRDEMPRHQVHIEPFAIDVHPVSNEQFVLYLESMGGEKDNHNHDLIVLRESRIRRSAGKLLIESGYAKHPVVGVTWYGAVAYAQWVGMRLPSEAEWEIAAKGGDEDAVYPNGSQIDRSQANFFSSDTTPVMSYPANPFGLYDMAGNIYEWCQDWYAYNYYDTSAQEPHKPHGPLQGVYRVIRGGCWKSLQEDLRCAHRHRNNPGTVNSTYGFRCARSL